MRVLILGGTTEGRTLAEALSRDERCEPIYSLAGRTGSPMLPSTLARVGGFGGADGLAAWLRSERIDAIVDATHPYAERISANAALAARACALPLLLLQRPPWRAEPGDMWCEAADADAAAAILGDAPLRALLTIGRSEIAAFQRAAHHHYVVRAVDPPEASSLPPRSKILLQRGPFALDDELALMRAHRIQVVVSKNSGGDAAYPKILAARSLGVPVVMLARPAHAVAAECSDVASAVDWVNARLRAHGRNPSERGV